MSMANTEPSSLLNTFEVSQNTVGVQDLLIQHQYFTLQIFFGLNVQKFPQSCVKILWKAFPEEWRLVQPQVGGRLPNNVHDLQKPSKPYEQLGDDLEQGSPNFVNKGPIYTSDIVEDQTVVFREQKMPQHHNASDLVVRGSKKKEKKTQDGNRNGNSALSLVLEEQFPIIGFIGRSSAPLLV